jgi:gluconolactonase
MSKQISVPDVGEVIAGVVEVIDPRAHRSLDSEAGLVRLTGGAKWAEGPVYLPSESAVMFSDIPNDRALIWSEATGGVEWRRPNDYTNGNTLDREGRIVHCEHGNRRIARTELDGTRRGLVDRHDGKRLNSPNDVVVKSDGTIWFSDPPYGILSNDEGYQAPQEQEGCYVYRLEPDSGELTVVSDAVDHPNGLAFSPDESRLYVSDTSAVPKPGGNHHIVVFDVIDGRELSEPRVLVVMEPGLPDGLRVDENSDIWTSAGDSIHLIDPDGRDLALIRVPEKTSNCVFGGTDGRRLFITASSSLYAIDVKVRGAGVAAAAARAEGLS